MEDRKCEVMEVVETRKTDVELRARLKELGMTAALGKLDLAAKLTCAYDKYLFVSQESFDLFNKTLKARTLKKTAYSEDYQTLIFIPHAKYGEIPPQSVLNALQAAKGDGIFDAFEIAKIEERHDVKDPILFGVIYGCSDRFFISQWDDDVKVEDILFQER